MLSVDEFFRRTFGRPDQELSAIRHDVDVPDVARRGLTSLRYLWARAQVGAGSERLGINGLIRSLSAAPFLSRWTTRTSAADNNWLGVTWSPELGLFCAVASSGTGDRVMTSPDGIVWTSRTSAADNTWYAVTWSPELGLFCAVSASGTGNRVMTSRRLAEA